MSEPALLAHPAEGGELHDDIVYPEAVPFVLFHLAALGVLFTGVGPASLAGAAGLYLVRMWAVTAGFHRYFAHRSYKTGRAFQLLLAFLGQTSGQRGVLWWAAIHRHHHLHSDTGADVHSPRHAGFFHAHVGWIFDRRRNRADYDTISDLTRFPELVWLDRHPYVPLILLGVACGLVGGLEGLFVSYFLGTVVLYHCVFAINSLAHVVGRQRYLTGDDSRNNWWLALLTLGEGWHNNHHHYQSATAQGWRWYEIDPTYWVLLVLSRMGVVRDLRSPPEEVVRGERRLGRKVVEKVALQLAASFPLERLTEQAREAWAGRPRMEDLTDVHLPHLPTRDELRARAREMFADTPSLDDVAERAREMLREAVHHRLREDLLQA